MPLLLFVYSELCSTTATNYRYSRVWTNGASTPTYSGTQLTTNYIDNRVWRMTFTYRVSSGVMSWSYTGNGAATRSGSTTIGNLPNLLGGKRQAFFGVTASTSNVYSTIYIRSFNFAPYCSALPSGALPVTMPASVHVSCL